MNKKTKSENKKALGPFLILLVLCSIGGGIVGGLSNMMSIDNAKHLKIVLANALITGSPLCLFVTNVVLIISVTLLLIYTKKVYKDISEDDNIQDSFDFKVNIMMTLLVIQISLSFLFFGIFICSFVKPSTQTALFTTIVFIVSIAFNIVLTQLIIDYIKKLNPEKHGSVYDLNFTKKWEESSDERELLETYRAGYRSYKFCNLFLCFSWVVITLGSMFFSIGILPVVLVSLFWFVHNLTYCIYSMRNR